MLVSRFFLFIVTAFLLCFLGDVTLAQRNPPPVFETDYTLPETETPASPYPETTDDVVTIGLSVSVMLYALFLTIAGFAVHRWRSRKILFCLAVCSVAVLGFLLWGCPCPVGMFQNIVQAVVEPGVAVSWTVILLFTLPLFAALFFGRVFCSSVCPLGAVQELTAFKNLKISDRAEHILGLFRFFWLGIGVFCVVVGLGYLICRYDPFVSIFRLTATYPLAILLLAVLGIGFFIGRPFCRFFCPYGALLGLCGSLAGKKVTITPGKCDQCKLCENVCPYNAILPPTTKPTSLERWDGPLKLAGTILAFPIILLLFAQIGAGIAPRLVMWHPDIRTAKLLYLEEERWVETSGYFPETRGLVQIGTPTEEVYERAVHLSRLFRVAGLGLGLWVGLVIGIKWIVLTMRHPRVDYEVDPARCFACGRCFWYCPNQKEPRLLLIGEEGEPKEGM